MLEIRESLAFDDILIVPQYSEITSRALVNLSVKIGEIELYHPIIPANMQSVTGHKMALQALHCGGLAILHRFMPLTEQLTIVEDIADIHSSKLKCFGVSLGVKSDDVENFEQFYKKGVRLFCIDIAHGNSRHCVDMIKTLKEHHDDITLIAGNVATGDGARRLWEAGADIVKVGVGSGSLCTTRIETGNGVPQLTALMDVKKVQQDLLIRDLGREPQYRRSYPFISDGGCKSAGDLVKALCFADLVMTGNLFAGCPETPAATHYIQGAPHKEYAGSSTHKANHIEGVVAWVPCTGTYNVVLIKLLEGIRSGMSYQGVNNLEELKDNPTFIRITNAGLKESHPHDVYLK